MDTLEDMRRFALSTPDVSDLLREVAEISPEESEKIRSECAVAVEVRRRLSQDTVCVRDAETKITACVDAWRTCDGRISQAMDEASQCGTDASRSFGEQELVSKASRARDALRDLRQAVSTCATSNLREIVGNAAAPYARREVARIALGERETSCPICMCRDPDSFVSPCGHVMCAACVDQVTTRCFTCRSPVVSKHRLFFS